MKRIISILLAIGLILFAYANVITKTSNEVPYVQAVDTLTYPDYSLLYTCKPDKRNDNCLYITIYDADLLMKIARQEGGPTLDGQLWAMRVIYNRLYAGNFGDSVWEIVSSTGQFDVFTTGAYINADINAESHIALAMLEGGWDETQGALYWRSDKGSCNSWHERNLQYIATVDGNRYYK